MIRFNVTSRLSLAALIAAFTTTPLLAQQSFASLGQSWPQTTNVSAAPGWRVYVFMQDGVKYIQANDLVGTVRVAVATQNGYFLVLPMGADAQRVSTPARPLAAAIHSTAPAITVYQDSAVQLTVRYQSDGSTLWTATAKTSPKTTTTPTLAPAVTELDCPPCGASGH